MIAEEPRLHQRTCPLCEGMCGIDVTVAQGRVTAIRPNKANVWSRGHICPKGTTLGELHHDPDRLRTPMIREGSNWRQASWEEAFAHADGLARAVRARYGQSAFASFGGNMSGKGFASARYMMLLYRLARFAQSYSSSSVDQLPKNVSSYLLYGNMWKIPIPDVDRTDLFVMLGANPAESKGSIFSHRDAMGAIRALRDRGGRFIVVDPVRTRTAAAADEWLPLRPGSDAAFLLAIVNVLFAEGRVRLGPLEGMVDGVDELAAVAAAFPPERVARFCGLEAADIRRVAGEIADARAAAIYGRIGTCTQAFGTLASWLVDAIAILTGNLDSPGGSMWSTQVAPHLDLAPPYSSDGSVSGKLSRVRGVPAILGQLPANCLAEEIDTPGEGQIRALMTLGGNPVLSVPGSARLDAALEQLECMISIDIYINETTRHAHVIFPSPSLLEQPHWDVWAWPWALTSGGHYSPALFEPTDRPPEWQVMARVGAIMGGVENPDLDALDDEFFGGMCDHAGVDRPTAFAALPERGPERILDLCIRSGPFGDGFGAWPDGLRLDHFKAARDGILMGPAVPLGSAAITTPNGRIALAHPHFLRDVPRLEVAIDAPDKGLLLVSRRQLRSLNSWMHNLNTLVKGKPRCTLQLHPDDALDLHLATGDTCEVESQAGVVHAPVEVTDDIMRGVVSLPHGWGHDRDGTHLGVARLHAGANINELSPAEMIDPASGNAVCNGIPVAVRRVA